MDYKRWFLYGAFILIVLQLYAAWLHDYPQQPAPSAQTSNPATTLASPQTANHSNVPTNTLPAATPNNSANPTTSTENYTPAKLIHIQTDVLQLTIDTKGGTIVTSKLLKYQLKLNDNDQKVVLLNHDPQTEYLAQSGLYGPQGPDSPSGLIQYSVNQDNFSLAANTNELQVSLHWQSPQGLKLTKTFVLTRGSYVVDVKLQIQNDGTQAYNGYFYAQLARRPVQPSGKGFFQTVTYLGAAISTPEKLFEKIPFTKMQDKPLARDAQGGWIAMLQHYFVSAWIPSKDSNNHFYTNVNNGLYTIGLQSQKLTVNPGETKNVGAQLYTGPEITTTLDTVAPGLNLTVDYGILWPISMAIFWLMRHIYQIIGNWGWSIILVTVIIKLLFFKLSATSYRSMAKMRKLQPKIESLKELHGSDRQKFSQAMMELYRKEKVNPLSGCLPILVQIPVFLALYWVLIESVELRLAPFILWIHDLSAMDPYFVLPLLMGATMFIQQRMSPAPPDPMQAKVMMAMPVMFTVLFLFFPAGLVLYWLVSNVLSILQQWYITKHVLAETSNGRGKSHKK